MSELAFESDALDLADWERAGARLQYEEVQSGIMGSLPTAVDLIECIQRHGPLAGYLESARLLPVEEYWRVEEIHREAMREKRSKRWRPSR